MNVARESTVERMGDDELLDERGALDRRVTRGSEDSPPVLGPCSELDARRLDPAPQDMSCDMVILSMLSVGWHVRGSSEC